MGGGPNKPHDGVITVADADRIALAVARALQGARSVSDSEHWDHHQWISAQKLKEQQRAQFYADLRMYLAKRGAWGVAIVLGGALLALLLAGARTLLKQL